MCCCHTALMLDHELKPYCMSRVCACFTTVAWVSYVFYPMFLKVNTLIDSKLSLHVYGCISYLNGADTLLKSAKAEVQ